jgi:hypothetical protein
MIHITLQFNLRSVEFHCVMGRSMADVTLLLVHVCTFTIHKTGNTFVVETVLLSIYIHTTPSTAEAVNGYTYTSTYPLCLPLRVTVDLYLYSTILNTLNFTDCDIFMYFAFFLAK